MKISKYCRSVSVIWQTVPFAKIKRYLSHANGLLLPGRLCRFPLLLQDQKLPVTGHEMAVAW